MIASTRIRSTETFAFIAVLDFKLLSRKVLFINRKDKKKLLKSRLLFKKISWVNYFKFINSCYAKFSGYF